MTSESPLDNEQNNTGDQYLPLFERYLLGALRQSLAAVRAHRYTVPDDVRLQAWHMLRMTLDVDELWAQASTLLIELAPRMEMAGMRQEWIPFLEWGITRAEALGDELVEAKGLYHLGQLYRMIGQYGEASDCLSKSEGIYSALGDDNGQALVLNERAFITFLRGNYPATKILAENALTLFDSKHPERAMSHYHLGTIAKEHSNLDAARSHYEMALKIRRTNEDQRWIAGGLRNLGIIYTGYRQYEEADAAFEEAMLIHDVLQDPARQVSTLISKGILLYETQQYQEAINCYHRARAICEQLLEQDSLATIYNNLAMAYKELSRWQVAIESAKNAIRIRQRGANPHRLANAMDTLGEIYLDQKDYSNALKIYKDAMVLIQSLPNIQSTEIYMALNARIEYLGVCIAEEGHTHT